MFTVPHRLIEGCLITAHAIGCDKVFIYIRGEYLHEFEVIKAALEEVHKAKLLGGVTIVLHRGAGAYICGEETALLESLEGKRGQPRTKPPFPAVAGLYASPSLINNVETIATVPKIIELGAKEYAKMGAPPDSSGTRVFSLSGNVVNGGNYELPMGVTLRQLIYDIGGGIPDGRELKAVIPGGSSVPVLTADQIDVSLDADLDGRGRLDARLGRDHRHGRSLLHGAARPAGGAVLHARELRQVHAVPRGHALDGADPRVDRGGDGVRGRPRPAARRLRPDPRQVPLPARRRGRDAGGELHRQVPRRVPGRTSTAAARCRASRRSRTCSPRSTSTRTTRSPRCRRERDRDRDGHGHRRRTRGRRSPKGTGLVETAAAAGIEIPVFCYEPRLGPAVGACRMCLVEIEGNPKLQAGCTLTAQDGMIVRTAQSSAKAAEGQNATLEFILVNHPLDCPVCDKGGECPLQDLTFKYGPGQTRMTFPKRTFDKPIPISPAIALDRERCILCYRCTRFSSDVAEDGQLVARNRGAQSLIATFEDESYRAPFSGNVIELCPVGALDLDPVPLRGAAVGDPERPDRLRPLPGRLQHQRDDARGQGQADPLAQPPRGRPGLAVRQGPLRLPAPLLGRPDRRPARARAPARLRRAAPGTTRSTAPRRSCAARRAASSRRSRARRRSSRPTRSGSCCARGSARTRPCWPRRPRPRSTRSARRSRRSPTRRSSSWSARRRSRTARRSSSSGSSRRAATAPRSSGCAEPKLGEELEQRVSCLGPRDPDLVGTRRRRRREARGARAPARPRRQARLRAPSTCPRPRTAAASRKPGRRRRTATRRTRSRSGS